jgi:hypothetical protein
MARTPAPRHHYSDHYAGPLAPLDQPTQEMPTPAPALARMPSGVALVDAIDYLHACKVMGTLTVDIAEAFDTLHQAVAAHEAQRDTLATLLATTQAAGGTHVSIAAVRKAMRR